MAHPLDGAFAKLERAYQRICELHESINAFINADEPKPYLIRAERYNERTEERFIPTVTLGYRNIAVDDPIEPVQHVPHGVIATVGVAELGFHIDTLQPFPALPFGIAIGEIVHDLRCALDYVVWELSIDHQ